MEAGDHQFGQIFQSLEDDGKDDLTRLPLWYGDPNLDILTPEHWIKTVKVSDSSIFPIFIFVLNCYVQGRIKEIWGPG